MATAPQMPQGATMPQPAARMPASPEQVRSMTEQALKPLLQELKSKPKDADLLARIAVTYGQAGQFDSAVQYFQRAIDIKPTAPLYTDLAITNHFAGADDKAEKNLNHALEVDPNYPNALFNLGALKMKVHGDTNGAIALWEKMLKASPDSPHRAEVEAMIAKARQGGAPKQ
jgi:cytochrome c-type biogenesis protein CcmH/NrfG